MNTETKLDLDALEARVLAASQFTEVSPGETFEVWDAKRSYRLAESEDIAFISAANPQAILELIRRLREAEADAARYRYFISCFAITDDEHPINKLLDAHDSEHLPTKEELDAAIDAAMVKEKQS